MKYGNRGDSSSVLVVGEVKDKMGIPSVVLLIPLARVASLCVIVPVMAITCLLFTRSVAVFTKV